MNNQTIFYFRNTVSAMIQVLKMCYEQSNWRAINSDEEDVRDYDM